MKFLLMTSEKQKLIGSFNLDIETRTWSFSYDQSFIYEDVGKINEFPDLNMTYGHTKCVEWLSYRVGEKTLDGKGIRLAELVNLKGNINSQYLEIHPVQ